MKISLACIFDHIDADWKRITKFLMVFKKTLCCLLTTSLFSSFIFSLPSLSPWKLLDNQYCSAYGHEQASPQYQAILREFLNHLGVEHPERIPIRKISSEAAENYLVPGITRSTGIWLNEQGLFNGPLSSQQVYMLAHQAAYYTMKNQISLLSLYKSITDTIPMVLPFIEWLGYYSFFVRFYERTECSESIDKKSIAADAALLTAIHWVPSLVHDMMQKGVFAISKKLTKKTDLAAAHVLCEKGFSEVVQEVIKHLEMDISQGKKTGPLHPSPQEIRNYLKDCLEEWNKNK